jgi:hypothetical protein
MGAGSLPPGMFRGWKNRLLEKKRSASRRKEHESRGARAERCFGSWIAAFLVPFREAKCRMSILRIVIRHCSRCAAKTELCVTVISFEALVSFDSKVFTAYPRTIN